MKRTRNAMTDEPNVAELYKGYYLVRLDDRWTVVLAGRKFGVYPKVEQARAKIDSLVGDNHDGR